MARDPVTASDVPAAAMPAGALSALLERVFADERAPQGGGWGGALRSGAVIGRFQLVREIGRGAFGVVYEAVDRELGRAVAFKAVQAGSRPDVYDERLLSEADAAARLSHPNIVTLHDVGRSEFGPYLILELLEGRTLARRFEDGPVPVAEALRIAAAVARGLAHAHAKGVVHRDLTPGNVFLCRDSQVKVLDLGMAHAFGRRKVEGGTPAYMAPEQWRGAPEDERTDVFALGVILYRMFADRLPYPDDARSLRKRSPPRIELQGEPGLGALVARMLDPDPVRRPRDAGEVVTALEAFERELQREGSSHVHLVTRRPWRIVAAAVAVAVVAASGLGIWLAHREVRIRWALQALPRITELVEQNRYEEAFELATRVERVIPDDARLARLWPEVSRVIDVETTPPGADLYLKEYGAPDEAWQHLGRSPLNGQRLPLPVHLLRIEKPGYVPVVTVPQVGMAERLREAAPKAPVRLSFTLDERGRIPPDMVRVTGGRMTLDIVPLDASRPVRLGDFLIDRTEVTNRAFKQFVDAGGYRRRELWKHPFNRDGRVLSWQEAMALFHDRSGRQGPAPWVSGDFGEGEGDLPVTGVSWYEAAAYAELVGKTLPNVYQWARAAGAWGSAEIVPRSNFGDRGLAPVASYRGVGPFGTYDMAGNAKEWCWNDSGNGRYVLGGAWNEPSYMFNYADALAPLDRPTNVGFRLVKTLDQASAPEAWYRLPRLVRDFAAEQPVPANVFRVFKRLYAYDPVPLDARVEATEETERWRKEKVSFAAAYGGERVLAYLFTPRRGTAPFQTVVFFPGTSAVMLRSSEQLTLMRLVAPIVSSGRAVIYPVYKSTYERGDGLDSTQATPTAGYRDHVIAWSKDLERSIDWAQTRSDLDARRVALYGVSWGAKLLPLFAAVEDRIALGIMVSGGLSARPSLPEVDPFHFAPWVHQPILMVNGRYDFLFPLGAAQLPLFDLIGTPGRDKRHVVVNSGHLPPSDVITREVLEWLDRYLGPTR